MANLNHDIDNLLGSYGVNDEIDALLDYHGVPLCSIVVVNKEGIIFKSAFGESSSAQTQFHLFSGTKLYTATAVMRLVEDERISLDDMASKYVPGFDLDGITIEHLLGHCSGLVDTPIKAFLSGNFRDTYHPTSWDAFKKYIIKINRKPGELSSYANVNYVILGQVIEHVTGGSYEDYVHAHILKPLGSKACFSFREADNLAKGWIGYWNSLMTKLVLESDQYDSMFKDSKKLQKGKRGAGLYSLADFDVDSPCIGGLVGTAEDFAPLLVEVLRHAAGHDSTYKPTCISSRGIKMMTDHHFNGQIGVHSKVGAGLGWKIGDNFINHEGGGPGFTSETRCYLEDGIGIIVMMNKWSISHTECTICHELCELIRRSVKAKT